jgi:hypothetical protein
MAKRKTPAAKADRLPVCFVIMPIRDYSDRPEGHFLKVYRQIFQPACKKAGYEARRADDFKETSDINIDVLDQLLGAPMCLCDLSAHNPNVLFELGIRMAFNKPVTICQENGTDRIFDISTIRYTPYRKGRIHDEVLDDVKSIAEALVATRESAGEAKPMNSITYLLALKQVATVPATETSQTQAQLELLRSDIASLRRNFIPDNERGIVISRKRLGPLAVTFQSLFKAGTGARKAIESLARRYGVSDEMAFKVMYDYCCSTGVTFDEAAARILDELELDFGYIPETYDELFAELGFARRPDEDRNR